MRFITDLPHVPNHRKRYFTGSDAVQQGARHGLNSNPKTAENMPSQRVHFWFISFIIHTKGNTKSQELYIHSYCPRDRKQ